MNQKSSKNDVGLAEQMSILRFNYLHVNNNIVSKDQYDLAPYAVHCAII